MIGALGAMRAVLCLGGLQLDQKHALDQQIREVFADPSNVGAAQRNDATLNATTVLAMLYWLGIKPSYWRPKLSEVRVLR